MNPNLEFAVPSLGEENPDERTGAGLPLDEIHQIHRAATLLKFPMGTSLYSEGDKAAFVYLLGEGFVRISRTAESGHRQVLDFRAPGDILGFPDHEHYVNSADTVTHVCVYRIAWVRLQQMMLENPQLQFNLFKRVMRDFRQAQARIVMLGQQNTCQRLATFLIGLMNIPEFYDSKNAVLRIPVNRFDLADFLGTAPESAARAFAKLETRGLIRRSTSRAIKVMDLPGLRVVQRGPRREARSDSPVADNA